MAAVFRLLDAEDALSAPQIARELVYGAIKGFGNEPASQLTRLLPLLLRAKEDALLFSLCRKEVEEHTLLAVRFSSERLCLWYRAHQLLDSQTLSAYFDTTYHYFLSYWKQQTASECAAALADNQLPAPKVKKASVSVSSEGDATEAPLSPKHKDTAARPQHASPPRVPRQAPKSEKEPPRSHPPPAQVQVQAQVQASALSPSKSHADNDVTAQHGAGAASPPRRQRGMLCLPSVSALVQCQLVLPRAPPSGRSIITAAAKPAPRHTAEKEDKWVVLTTGGAAPETRESSAYLSDAVLQAVVQLSQSRRVMAERVLEHQAAHRPSSAKQRVETHEVELDAQKDDSEWWTRRYSMTFDKQALLSNPSSSSGSVVGEHLLDVPAMETSKSAKKRMLRLESVSETAGAFSGESSDGSDDDDDDDDDASEESESEDAP